MYGHKLLNLISSTSTGSFQTAIYLSSGTVLHFVKTNAITDKAFQFSSGKTGKLTELWVLFKQAARF